MVFLIVVPKFMITSIFSEQFLDDPVTIVRLL